MAYSDLSTVLKELMSDRNLTSSELARKTGVGQPVVHRMMSGKSGNPKVNTLQPIAEFFVISISQLIGDEPLSTKKSLYNEVPLLSWADATQWPTNKGSISISNIIATDREVGENAFALRIKDSTMLPRFPEGTDIIIDPDREPQDRDFSIVHLGDQSQVTFKQILIDGEDIYLKPLNPEFKTHMLNDREYKIKGLMIQARINP